MLKQIILLFAALALVAQDARAGDKSRIGTSAAQELRIPIGSAGPRWAARFWPMSAAQRHCSGILRDWFFGAHKREVVFSYLDYIADMNINYVALTTHLRDDISIGISARVFSVGDIIVTTEESPEGTGEVLFAQVFVRGVHVFAVVDGPRVVWQHDQVHSRGDQARGRQGHGV